MTESELLSRSSNNFDFIRISASVFVLIGHSSDVLYNKHLSFDPAKWLFGFSLQSLGVLIFFIISGFLVTKSFENKTSWIRFLAGRVLRIFPALIVVILISVFMLGSLVTTLHWNDYFSNHLTWQYLQNITLFRMYYYLPGVFDTNPIAGSVNASLWTLPYEFTCYLYIALIGIYSLMSNKWISLVLFLVYFTAYLFWQVEIDKVVIPIIGIDFRTFFLPFLFFLSGSVFYKFRHYIQFHIYGLLVCVAIFILTKINFLHHQFLIPAITYIVLAFALSKNIRMYAVGKYGDFSYGLYLYAFPVQQLLVFLLPFKPSLIGMILLSFLCTFPFAWLSWYFVEKPALQLKRYGLQIR